MAGLYLPWTEHDACGLGFVAHMRGQKSRDIVTQSLEILRRLAHRGACGADPDTGDGAGILIQLPHQFLAGEAAAIGIDLPRPGRYGVGMIFLPQRPRARATCMRILENAVESEGQRVLGWRDVPVDTAHVGQLAEYKRPVIRQIFVGRRRVVPTAFERTLYAIRKLAENEARDRGVDLGEMFHIASLSASTLVYKGLLKPTQLEAFYPDLQRPELVSGLALVHSRFSTNTFPTWGLAQPMRYIAHNGEINTVRGNVAWMTARRSLLLSAKFGGPLDRLFPIIAPGGSDSAQFDNMLELLVLGGRTLAHAMMMMIPEAWENDALMGDDRRAFYEYSSALLEPWDGPAAVAFSDGTQIGACLDRNGLRPARYLVTSDDRVILASETGVIDVPDALIVRKGRLQPGRMFLVDTSEGRIVDDGEIKREVVGRYPYRRWLRSNVFALRDFADVPSRPPTVGVDLLTLQRAMGYTEEDLEIVLDAMALHGKEPTGSMGNDAPLAVLSNRNPPLFSYFHQLFAQVTNPPIDPLREALVMSLRTAVGPDGNTFEETPEQCHRLVLDRPVLTTAELAKILAIDEGSFDPITLSTCFSKDLRTALDALCLRAEEAVDEGHTLVVLSDREVGPRRPTMPSLLALGAVHHHLVRTGTRQQVGIVVETAEARDVHHVALLVGFGAAAVSPWLALDTVRARSDTPDVAERNYIEAVGAGLLKIMSKMGISTLHSYRGAQIFEAVGISASVVDTCFSGVASRLGGLDLEDIEAETRARHHAGFGPRWPLETDELDAGGDYGWRRRGEVHKWNPATIARLQDATRRFDQATFSDYCRLADDESDGLCQLRSLFDLVPAGPPVPLAEVERATEIVRRFATGAMSFGSLSAEAHETLAIAMNRMGGVSNSGEGGEEARRNIPDANGDLRRSAIKQVASGRFGVTTEYLVNADDLQIKMAQGAKPGEGGQLPGHKVDERIARVRHSTPGVTLISPPPHHDIYSIEDLAQLIHDLRAVNPVARISVKLVSEVGVGTVAAGVAKAGADAVVIAGHSGGTGASPLSSVRYAGLPWELGLSESQQVLVRNGLRDAVRVQVDGGLRTARDVVVGALLGADEFGFSTAALVAVGCILLRKCHLNTCSVGIATQDPVLRARFAGTPEVVVNFFLLLAEEIRTTLARLGFRTLEEAVGRVDCLRAAATDHPKARTLDLGPILYDARGERLSLEGVGARPAQRARVDLDRRILAAIDAGAPLEFAIHNTDRSVGAWLSGELVRRGAALADGAAEVCLTGAAGQSLGAFLVGGVTLRVVGDTNDYLGKGLSGGRLVVHPPRGVRFASNENVITGNTALYGATAGEAFVSGVAGERFGVRNSGARAVVEGVGDHCCEYMTGGVVVVLGEVGRNFAAGMSGGTAYVFDRAGGLRSRTNLDMVELEPVIAESDTWLLQGLIRDHVRYTGSFVGQAILEHWESMRAHFVKVIPVEYKRALLARRNTRQAAVIQ